MFTALKNSFTGFNFCGRAKSANRLTDSEIQHCRSALFALYDDLINSAVLLGASKLEERERSIAAMSLRTTAQGVSILRSVYSAKAADIRRGIFGDRHEALSSVNGCVKEINQVRTQIGAPHLLYLTGFGQGE